MRSGGAASVARMLREAKNVRWESVGRRWAPRARLVIGRTPWPTTVPRRAWASMADRQEDEPVSLLTDGARRYWWFRDRFYWEDEALEAADVLALVHAREQQQRRRLDRAHALLAAEREPAAPRREGIPQAVKVAVWERCGGACVECGSAQLLEFDHVIPVALGGSSGERNLQLLCADCNRAKGASL